MSTQTFKQLRLKKRPQAGEFLSLDNYEVTKAPVPQRDQLNDGEVLAKVTHLSCDPTLRIWASDRPQYMPPVQLGEVMRALGIATVVESKNASFAPGDRLTGLVGWTEYVVGHPVLNGWTRVPLAALPDEVVLGPVGLTGLTAYFGLFDLGKPQPGDVVLVSGAAGATGSVVVQLAKLAGCRVVGIAGGADKAKIVKEVYGADDVIDYKTENIRQRVKELAGPNGFDIYFDNVGGESLEAALDNLALRARVVLCGAIAEYNSTSSSGPANYLQLLMKRATMTGFIVLDFKDRFVEAGGRLGAWIQAGKLKFETDVQEGPLEKAPEVLNRLYTGANKGKQLHKLVSS